MSDMKALDFGDIDFGDIDVLEIETVEFSNSLGVPEGATSLHAACSCRACGGSCSCSWDPT